MRFGLGLGRRVPGSDTTMGARGERSKRFSWLGCLLSLTVELAAHAVSLTPLGDLPGGTFDSSATALSADGSIVVGTGTSASGTEAFIWDAVDGMRGLGDLPGGTFSSSATGVSADGSIVVGSSTSASGTEAFIWDAVNGMRGLGDLPGGAFSSSATALSADGSVVVGFSHSASGTEAFIWDAVNGMRGLGDLPGRYFYSQASGVSADGSIVVGSSESEDYRSEAFIWDAINGMRGLGQLPATPGNILTSYDESIAEGVSADGSIVVGSSTWGTNTSSSGTESFIWDAVNRMRAFSELPGGDTASRIVAISPDGWFLLVGGGGVVSIWDAINGVRGLVDLSAATYISSVGALSADGSIVAGTGWSALGWQAFIASIPEGRDNDGDGTPDHVDSCPRTANPDQADADSDGVGDACSDDPDEDGMTDPGDNCPRLSNPDQSDADSDGVGNACNNASDPDGDEWADLGDNCPTTYNPDQADSDLDGRGDVCNSSYQKTDGTIVYPITYALCPGYGQNCQYYSASCPFVGPPLGPGVRIPPGSNTCSADLRDADLREADLRVSYLGSDLRRSDLAAADLRGASVSYTNLEMAKLARVDLRGHPISRSHLFGVDLHGARLRINCEYTSISNANLSGAILRDSNFFSESCDLREVNFENADLRGSSFQYFGPGLSMNRADLRGAYFSFAPENFGAPYYDGTTTFYRPFDPVAAGWINLDEVDTDSDGIADSPDNCRFAANADQTDGDSDGIGDACDFSPSTTCLEMGSLPRSTASLVAFQANTCEDWSWVEQPAAYLQSAVLTETYLRSANLSGAVMANVDLAGADLTAAHLVNANLANANLESAVLAYAHLAFANLMGANLADADLESADLADVLLTSAQYDEATVFPSGRKASEPPWGLPNDETPWNAGMIPVPEPGLAWLIGSGTLGLAGLGRRRQSVYASADRSE